MLRFYRLWVRVRARCFVIAARREFAAVGAGTSLQLPIKVEGADNISLGDGVVVQPGAVLLSYLGGRIEIGDCCRLFERVTITAQSSVKIGREVLISRNVHISDHDHRFDDPAVSIMRQGMKEPRPVTIGDGAWIGHGAVVMPGVTIGRNAVVGANAVVTRSVPDHVVVVGCPARPRKPQTP